MPLSLLFPAPIDIYGLVVNVFGFTVRMNL